MKRFVFVVDTDTYSGNFERELCGYLTGQYDRDMGDEGHGTKEAAIARAELSPEMWDYFDTHVMHCLEEPDDLPIHTPVVIWPTPGWFNHGMGGHFREGQEKEAFEHYKKEIEEYVKQHPMSDLKAGKSLKKCPAYQSVGIFFDERPDAETVSLLKDRAQKFAKDYWPKHKYFGHALEITGFRIIEEAIKTTASEEKV